MATVATDTCITAPVPADSSRSPLPPSSDAETAKSRLQNKSWLKRVFTTVELASDTRPAPSPPSSPSPSGLGGSSSNIVSTPQTQSVLPRPTSAPPNSTYTQTTPVWRPRTFASISLLPTIEYSYTPENSSWKVDPLEMCSANKRKKGSSVRAIVRSVAGRDDPLV